MAVKYQIRYRTHYDDARRVDIIKEDYFGEPIVLRTVQGAACTISYDCANENEPIINSSLSTTIVATGVDIYELQTALDRDFKVNYYEADILKWTGFLIPDGIQRGFQAEPFELTLTATDGIKLLDALPFTPDWFMVEGGKCLLNYIRQILGAPINLGLPLPIRWVNTVVNKAYPEQDVFLIPDFWDGYTDYRGNYKSCLYVLENILLAFRCRLYQGEGRWNIERINDVATGEYTYSEIPVSPIETLPVAVTVTGYNRLREIAPVRALKAYSLVNEDAMLTVKPSLKTCEVTYQQDMATNVLPNGNMDLWTFPDDKPLHWQLRDDPAGSSLLRINSLYAGEGSAVKVTTGTDDSTYFELKESLPIDSATLFKSFNIGFKFMPISGFQVDGDGVIIWGLGDASVLNLQVLYVNNDGSTQSLNSFGFWEPYDDRYTPIRVENVRQGDVVQVDFNNFQNIKIPAPVLPVINQTAPALKVALFLANGLEIAFDDIYLTVESNSDVYSATLFESKATAKDTVEMHIASSHNGFFSSSIMTNYALAGDELFFADDLFEGPLTALMAHSIMRMRYVPNIVFDGSIMARSWSYGECYKIVTFDEKKFLPLNAEYNTETCITRLTLIENRNDAVDPIMEHYGTNDKTLSSN